MSRALATYDHEAKLGPAMAALNPNMQQFALAILQTGCSQAKAAQLAGYTGDAVTLKATGWRLAHDQRVQAAIHEEAQKLIRSTSVMAIGVITEIAQSPCVDAKDRLKAAVELLNRSGLHAHTEHHLTVERPATAAEDIERVKVLAGQLGLDAKVLLGAVGVHAAIDAEFEVVQPVEDWTVNLEDLADA